MTIAPAASRLIRVVLSPSTLLGYVIWTAGLLRPRRSVSVTAQGPLSARWFQSSARDRRADGAADARAAELLRSCGLTLEEHHTLKRETNGERAWGGFALGAVSIS
jgi:hypothetical protein